jgi:hypothetical protein
VNDRGVSAPAHWTVQTESPRQVSEHESVQTKSQCEPASQVAVPLAPIVTTHVAWFVQW